MSKKQSQTITLGILGGTFDPIHKGHIACALSAYETFHMDAVKFIPCGTTPHKDQPKRTTQQRCDMVELALMEYEHFELDNRECRHTEQSEQQGQTAQSTPSYSIDTIKSLRQELGEKASLIFIIGSDAFETIETWHEYKDLLSHCHLLLVQRPGYPLKVHASLKKFIEQHQTQDTNILNESPSGKLFFHETPLIDVSSSQIRKDFDFSNSPNPSAGIKNISLSLPFSVKEYIHQNGLYQDLSH